VGEGVARIVSRLRELGYFEADGLSHAVGI
jgi:hypothetical protein